MDKRQAGFTLAELLIVVAIIAVLVAIAIPVFTAQLEKSQEATDAANIRSTYGELVTIAMSGDTSQNWDASAGKWVSDEIELKQKADGWGNAEIRASIENIGTQAGTPAAGGTATVEVNVDSATGNTEVTVRYNGGAATETINYNSVQSVGQYVYSNILDQLNQYKAGTLGESDLTAVFSSKTFKTGNTTVTLPNGQSVNVVVYSRDYDKFQDTVNRKTQANTASLIYNKDTGKLTTILYWDGQDYTSWTIDGDDDSWSSSSSWKENGY